MKGLVQRAFKRAGYTLYRDIPRDLANPLGVELASHSALLRAVIERAGVNCVLDVGAHRGGYGALLRQTGYAGEIVSFEPVGASFAALQARLDGAWRAHHLALGREAGSAEINVAHEANFTSFLEPNAFSVDRFGGSAVARTETVKVQRLDAVFGEVTAHVAGAPRVLLKTDTQGWDLEVIEGAMGVLDRVVALQCELSVRPIYEGSTSWLDVLARLGELGFRPAQLTSVGRDDALGLLELDCLLVRT